MSLEMLGEIYDSFVTGISGPVGTQREFFLFALIAAANELTHLDRSLTANVGRWLRRSARFFVLVTGAILFRQALQCDSIGCLFAAIWFVQIGVVVWYGAGEKEFRRYGIFKWRAVVDAVAATGFWVLAAVATGVGFEDVEVAAAIEARTRLLVAVFALVIAVLWLRFRWQRDQIKWVENKREKVNVMREKLKIWQDEKMERMASSVWGWFPVADETETPEPDESEDRRFSGDPERRKKVDDSKDRFQGAAIGAALLLFPAAALQDAEGWPTVTAIFAAFSILVVSGAHLQVQALISDLPSEASEEADGDLLDQHRRYRDSGIWISMLCLLAFAFAAFGLITQSVVWTVGLTIGILFGSIGAWVAVGWHVLGMNPYRD